MPDRIGTLTRMHRVVLSCAVAIALPGAARAGEAIHEVARAVPRHTVYAEAFGKAGPYGLGYELGITPRLALGLAASFAVVGDQQLATAAPYVHADLLRGARHSLYGDVGLVVVHSRIPSPVPEWDGMSETGAGGQVTLGWEWRPSRLVVRTSLGLAAGEGGIAPFLGLLLGARL